MAARSATSPLGTLAAADDRPAIVEPGRGAITYAELDRLANRIAGKLRGLGLRPGARIGIYMRRSADAIAVMLGTLRAGCAYVPVDPRAPAERIADSQIDCRVRATFVEERFEQPYRAALGHAGRGDDIAILRLGPVGLGVAAYEWTATDAGPDLSAANDITSGDLACILYTSGSTGRPKGWMMSRVAIEAHARWCHDFLAPTREDIFANHAQFSFGMSLFDIYSSLGCGATLVLVPDEVRQHGARVVDLLVRERVTIWFSGPAILSLIGQVQDLESRDLSALRVVAFAGEVFPLAQLENLRARLPHPRYFNFWGSTETNVGAHYELPKDLLLDGPPPFGRPCEHYEARVAAEDGTTARPAATGELQLRGIGLSSGYWNQPELTAEKLCWADDGGQPWFRTGDLAVQLSSGNLRYVGRIGRMVKLRGYRVEPGEIEARLYQHPGLREAAVVPVDGPMGLSLVAHISSATGSRLPVVELKEFCARKLPAYMIPDRFEFYDALPRTSSGKIDIKGLGGLQVAVTTR
ncbi:MAG TPA: amino acid adenylation domain-containing protein [Vicinamibacterales bacterium]|nr:amino acid adenylation domain-containing protein [Vicinamibacterales bacterium]